MAIKVYDPPTHMKQPETYDIPWQEIQQVEQKYLEELKAYLLERNPNGKNVGEIIYFPVADGHAQYMVASMRPLELVHIPLGDAWHFQYVERLKVKDIEDQIKRNSFLVKR
jgi:hypothetical protein